MKPHIVRVMIFTIIVCVPHNWSDEKIFTWLKSQPGYTYAGEAKEITQRDTCHKCNKLNFIHVTVE